MAGVIAAALAAVGSIANVAVTRSQERITDKNAKASEYNANTSEEIAQIQLIAAMEAENFKKIALIVITMIVLIVIIMYNR